MRTQRWWRIWAKRRLPIRGLLVHYLVDTGRVGTRLGGVTLVAATLMASGLFATSLVGQDQKKVEESLLSLDGEEEARQLLEAGELQAAKQLQEQTLFKRLETLGEDHRDTLRARAGLIETLIELGDLETAKQQAELAAKAHGRTNGPDHPETLIAQRRLASVRSARGELQTARKLLEEILAKQEDIAELDELEEVETRHELAITLYKLGEAQESRRLLEKTVAARTRLQGPDAPETLYSQSNLAVTLYVLGQIVEAREVMEALASSQQRVLGARHLDTLETRNNLAAVFYEQGHLEKARLLFEEAGNGYEQILGPKHPLCVGSRNNLAITLLRQGEPGNLVRPMLETSLSAQVELLGQTHLETLTTRLNVAVTYVLEGDLEQGRVLLEGILKDSEEALGWEHPMTLEMANGLSSVLRDLSKTKAASEMQERVLKSREENLGPNHPQTAGSVYVSASLLKQRGNIAGAEKLWRRALEIYRKIAPGSFDEADCLGELGRLYQETERLELAAAHFSLALDAVEHQTHRFRRRDLQSASRQSYSEIYRRAVQVWLELGKPEKALITLERSRARRFLEMLGERDSVFSQVPEDLEKVRSNLAVLYDRGLAQLASMSENNDPKRFEEQLHYLRTLRREGEKNDAAIRLAASSGSSLAARKNLSAEEIRQALDPGTVLLSYLVGDDSTLALSVTREGKIQSAQLPLGQGGLEGQIRLVHELLPTAIPGTAVGDYDLDRLRNLLRELYEVLVAPFAPAVEAASRLLVSPDGPLHLLPFSALLKPLPAGSHETSPSSHGERYLIEDKPIHTVLSATVYAELLSRRKAQSNTTRTLVAFGDPAYPEMSQRPLSSPQRTVHRQVGTETSEKPVDPSSTFPVLREVGGQRGFFDWKPLPQSRREVQAIAQLYPDSQVFLGANATEERIKTLGRSPQEGSSRIFHFATHGFLDDRLPMSSFLALTIPKADSSQRDNGLLQVWEIIESLRLNADLVVLSACSSGRGTKNNGEGLIGLSRAFQYAGARSVAATLWNVDDNATAELMIRFHHHLQQGLSHDEALRQAQMEMLRSSPYSPSGEATALRPMALHFSSPFSWAAFQIVGDWQ